MSTSSHRAAPAPLAPPTSAIFGGGSNRVFEGVSSGPGPAPPSISEGGGSTRVVPPSPPRAGGGSSRVLPGEAEGGALRAANTCEMDD